MAADPPIAAVVLAGGRAARLGGADKPGLRIGGSGTAGRTFVGAVVTAAIESGATQVIVVGEERPDLVDEAGAGSRQARVEFTREQPAGGGPVPALRAGIDLVSELWMLLLAADLPFLTGGALRELRSAAGAGAGTGAVLVDDAGRPQWLVSCWRTADLRAGLETYQGNSLRGLLAPVPHAEVAVPALPGAPPYWLDCDTPEDLAAAGRWMRPDVTDEREERP